MKERVWTQEVIMQNPHKWIIMTHLEWETSTNKVFGEVYAVIGSLDEAQELEKSLGTGYGEIKIYEGYDPTPQIGGLFRE